MKGSREYNIGADRKKYASFGKEFSEHRVCPAACGACKKTNADISFTLWQVGVGVTASKLSDQEYEHINVMLLFVSSQLLGKMNIILPLQ